jgi:hypothetical protein
MNEHILELAERATRRYDRLGFEIPFAQPDLEKFAELVVLECAAYLNGAAEVYDQQDQDTCDRAARHIKQYFGVK